MIVWLLLLIVFALALVFTWTNGFQGASAVAAGAIGSHSIEKKQAIWLCCIFEFIGTMLGGSAVAHTIQSLSSWPAAPSLLPILASALLSAIIWNIFASHLKMPVSSTHALIGGMIGALFAGDWSFDHVCIGKFDPVHPTGVIGAIFSMIMSPMLGFVVAYFLFPIVLLCVLRASSKAEHGFRHIQWVTTAGLAFGDGQNDTQKTMGLLVLALNSVGLLHQEQIPLWLRALTGLAMAIGAFALSPSVAKELAFKVYKLKPMNAAVAESSAASILMANSLIGGPVAASQVIAASIMGTGAAERSKGIHWIVIKDMLLSWVITIPATAVLALLVHVTIFRWLGQSL